MTIRLPRYTRSYRRNFPGPDWQTRTNAVLSFAVDYRGATILDAGCNLGIIGYEICKQEPAFYHGVDRDRAALQVAKAIFTGVDVKHRFDFLDLVDERQFHVLQPTYDIVLMLNVLQHIDKNRYKVAAALRNLAGRCRSTLIVTARAERLDMIRDLDAFCTIGEHQPPGSYSKYFHLLRR